MLRHFLAVLYLTLAAAAASAQAAPPTSSSLDARTVVRNAIEKMGGEARLRALHTIEWQGVGHIYLLEQSERPQGPWLVDYVEVTEIRDTSRGSLRRTQRNRSFLAPVGGAESTMIVAGGVSAASRGERVFPRLPRDVQEAEEWLALAPEAALIAALDDAGLRREADAVMQDTPQRVVVFTRAGRPMRLYLSAQTLLLTAAEIISDHPLDLMWGVWGDVVTRVEYSLWTLEAGGIRYPRQWDVSRNGQPYQSLTAVRLVLNAPVPDDAFAIPNEVQQAFAPRRTPIQDFALGWGARSQPVELAPGVVKIPGGWDVALVRQTGGVVVIEAPISSGYSARVLEEAARRFPGVPVKAVISTSDAWPHIGGVREYAARGVPIYALDLNRPILDRLMSASYRSNPDALARAPRSARFTLVSGRTVIGEGPNRLEVYPIRSESGERMLMVYFPEHRMLYAADLIQRQGNGEFFMASYLQEVMDAVTREKLDVQTVFAMHAPAIPWSEIVAAVANASKP